jgi:GrpB-like predicted nucleotidyltransferase (UPF0157 family)
MNPGSSSPEAIELSAYSPKWPVTFNNEKGRLTEIFGEGAVLIEHVGSTAVPGMGAKPIVDILLGAPSLAIVERSIPAMVETGYRYVPEFERALPQRRYLVKKEGHPGYFHLHAVVYDTPFWKDLLDFRDLLRQDASYAERYWRLKNALAARHRNDREAYANAKSEFIKNALAYRRGTSSG